MFSRTDWPMRIQTPSALNTSWLVHLEGREGLSELYRYKVGLLAEPSTGVRFKEFLGKRVQLRLELTAGSPRLINGIFSQLSRGNPVFTPEGEKRFVRYEAELVPALWLLSLNQNYRIFQDADTKAILEQLLKGQKVKLELREKYVPRPQCTQYGESDLNFICRLMEQEGIFFFFEQGSDQETLVIADHLDAIPYIAGQGIEFVEPPHARGLLTLDLSQQITAGKASIGDIHFERADLNLGATQPLIKEVKVGLSNLTLKGPVNEDLERYEFPGRFARWLDEIDKDGGAHSTALDDLTKLQQRAATLAAQRIACEAVRATGESNTERLTAGAKFDLASLDIVESAGNATHLVTSVEHAAGVEATSPLETEEFKYGNRFECQPFAIPYRTPLRTPRPVASGVDTAVVTGPAKTDVFTDKYGRVRVQFHWDRAAARGLTGADGKTLPGSNYWPGSGPATSSAWVRVMQGWAGPNFGELVLPRIGQEVAVIYLEGDPDAPMIQGCLYNSKNMPPFANNLEKSSGIRTRSIAGDTGKSSGLVFDDTKDAEMVNLHCERDLVIGAEQNAVNNVGGFAVTNVANGWIQRVGALPVGGSGGGGGSVGEAIEEYLTWTAGKVSASLGKDFQLIYGAYFCGASPLYAGEVLGGKWDLIVNPSAIFSASPAALLANKIGLGGRNDFILGNKTDILASKTWTVLGGGTKDALGAVLQAPKTEFVLWSSKTLPGDAFKSATGIATTGWYTFWKAFAGAFGICMTVEFWVIGGVPDAISTNSAGGIANLVLLGVLGIALLFLYGVSKKTLNMVLPGALFTDLIDRATLAGNLTVAAAALKAAAGARA